MRNVFIHTGVRWEVREYFDVHTMIAYNESHGREEDHIFVSMMQDFAFELPDMTPYYHVYTDETFYFNECNTIRKYRLALAKAMERFYCNPIMDWDLFKHFFNELGYYPSEDNVAEAKKYFNANI